MEHREHIGHHRALQNSALQFCTGAAAWIPCTSGYVEGYVQGYLQLNLSHLATWERTPGKGGTGMPTAESMAFNASADIHELVSTAVLLR